MSSYEVPKKDLRPGVVYKKVYGSDVPESLKKPKKKGEAPAQLIITPLIDKGV